MDREYCHRVPIVAMSANAFDDDVRHSIASGMMNAHIMKPIYMKKLNSTVQDVLTEGAGVPEEGENGDRGCHK